MATAPRVVDRIELGPPESGTAMVDAVEHAVRWGAWAFFVPALGLKLHHARGGKQICLHPRARRFTDPSGLDRVRSGFVSLLGRRVGNYYVGEWSAALAKPVTRRAAETYVSARRLAAAGLSPAIGVPVVVRGLHAPYLREPSSTAGFVSQDATALPPGPGATEGAIIAAGVVPDRIRSCIREQINGYVTDLNSVVGVMPIDAEAEIATLTARLNAALDADRMRAILPSTPSIEGSSRG